jgi:hypothetical protein
MLGMPAVLTSDLAQISAAAGRLLPTWAVSAVRDQRLG